MAKRRTVRTAGKKKKSTKLTAEQKNTRNVQIINNKIEELSAIKGYGHGQDKEFVNYLINENLKSLKLNKQPLTQGKIEYIANKMFEEYEEVELGWRGLTPSQAKTMADGLRNTSHRVSYETLMTLDKDEYYELVNLLEKEAAAIGLTYSAYVYGS